jgi:hypothetical protein
MTTSSTGDVNPQPGVIPIDPIASIDQSEFDPELLPEDGDIGKSQGPGKTGKLYKTPLEDRLAEIDRKRKVMGIEPMQSLGTVIPSGEYPLAPNTSHLPIHPILQPRGAK